MIHLSLPTTKEEIARLKVGDQVLLTGTMITGRDAAHLRNFYSLTGESRKEYIIKMAEAEAERIRIVRRAQTEAEGYRRIGEALAHIETRELVVKLAGLMALQQVSQSLAEGKATKLFLPQNPGDIFALIAGWQETLAATGSLPAAQAAPERQ